MATLSQIVDLLSEMAIESIKKKLEFTVRKPKTQEPESNAIFAKENTSFINACMASGIAPTKRQASKFRRGEGKAWEELMKHKEV
jgi:hypothetical protein